ncbi:MAG: phosphosulfolactate synthase [Acidimicrobiaceae bacterium]|nr:phosphosulfolactate synthase [Acidimicrobiaceae bacterium]MBO0746982.1 phosphosulfolactate synthase [Acidimicrobiaceae bacterium]
MPSERTSSLPFLTLNSRQDKPRTRGITEIRGPYYSMLGPRQLEDILEVGGPYIDWFKIPAPSLALLSSQCMQSFIDISHRHEVKVTAGGLIEFVLTRGPKAVDSYFDALRDHGFDVIEISAGFLAMSNADFLRLVSRAKRTGLKVKAEVGIQFGAGGSSSAEALAAEGTSSVGAAVDRGRRSLDAGADLVVLESEGVTEGVKTWRTDVPAAFMEALGSENVLFEAAEPAVFEWYIKNYGPDVNLFVDHSQALHLESLRSGVWGPASLFGRVVTYRDTAEEGQGRSRRA